MHRVLRFVVDADSGEDAVEKALDAFGFTFLNHHKDNRGNDGIYDYGLSMDEGRYEHSDVHDLVYDADSDEGREAMEAAWETSEDGHYLFEVNENGDGWDVLPVYAPELFDDLVESDRSGRWVVPIDGHI